MWETHTGGTNFKGLNTNTSVGIHSYGWDQRNHKRQDNFNSVLQRLDQSFFQKIKNSLASTDVGSRLGKLSFSTQMYLAGHEYW